MTRFCLPALLLPLALMACSKGNPAARCDPEGELLAEGSYTLSNISVDEEAFYWLDLEPLNADDGVETFGVLSRQQKSARRPTVIYRSDASAVEVFGKLLFDSTHVYWLDRCLEVSATCVRLQRMPKAGGEATTLVEDKVFDFALDEARIYYSTSEERGLQTEEPGTVWSIPKEGGTPTALITGLPHLRSVMVDETFVYWGESIGKPKGLAPYRIVRMPKAGGTPQEFLPNTLSLSAADGTSFYTVINSNVVRVPKSGGPSEVITPLATLLEAARMTIHGGVGIAVDETHLYFSLGGDWEEGTEYSYGTFHCGAIVKVPKGGGAPKVIAREQTLPGDIAVDETHVYWASRGEDVYDMPGTLWRKAK